MEWAGWVALILVLCYSSYPGKVTKLEKKVNKLEKGNKGESEMSKIFNELVGKECDIETDGVVDTDYIGENLRCTVLDVDEEWIKFTYTNKKNVTKTKILRIDAIDSVELVEEEVL